MNKKVVIVSSTLRKRGNSDALADEFVRGTIDAGNFVKNQYTRFKFTVL